MSLVITSNTPKNVVNQATTGINLPYSYINHLQGTLQIPPKSQIAVQSVKINKTGNIQLNKFNTQFGFYIGRDPTDADWNKDKDLADIGDLDATDLENNSLMVPTYILTKDEANKNFSYNTNRIAEELQTAWSRSIYHPNLQKNASTTINPGPSVVALRNASDQGFLGFDLRLHNASDLPAGALPPGNSPSTWINSVYGGTTATGTGQPTLTNPDTIDFQSYIGTDYPLSLVNGSFNCSFGTHRSVGGKGFNYSEFAIGLTRACNPTSTNTEDLPNWFQKQGHPMGFAGHMNLDNEFYDWVFASVWEPAESKHAVKLFHNVNGEAKSSNETTQLVEFDYTWMNGDAYYYLEDTESTNVVFNIKNERVSVLLEKEGAGTDYLLTAGSDTGGATGFANASNMKPVCPSTRYLYPKLLLKPTKSMDIKQFYGVEVANHTYASANYIDLWSQSKEVKHNQLHLNLKKLDTNINVSVADYNFKIMNRQPGLATVLGVGNRIEGTFRLVSSRSRKYFMSKSLNSDTILGFVNNTNATPSDEYTAVIPDLVRWTSGNVPSLTSKESMFVRLKNLTFESANFSNSAMSKILYHIPTFDNSGNDVGSLHLEPSEMVYLDLNNSHQLDVSTLEVDLVYNDETLATGVEGKTVVCFHIRRSRK